MLFPVCLYVVFLCLCVASKDGSSSEVSSYSVCVCLYVQHHIFRHVPNLSVFFRPHPEDLQSITKRLGAHHKLFGARVNHV